jgi:hypothetical protein
MMFIGSKGTQSSGRIQILTSTLLDDLVRIYISARVPSAKILSQVVVCAMDQQDGGIGVGIFVSRAFFLRPIFLSYSLGFGWTYSYHRRLTA